MEWKIRACNNNKNFLSIRCLLQSGPVELSGVRERPVLARLEVPQSLPEAQDLKWAISSPADGSNLWPEVGVHTRWSPKRVEDARREEHPRWGQHWPGHPTILGHLKIKLTGNLVFKRGHYISFIIKIKLLRYIKKLFLPFTGRGARAPSTALSGSWPSRGGPSTLTRAIRLGGRTSSGGGLTTTSGPTTSSSSGKVW